MRGRCSSLEVVPARAEGATSRVMADKLQTSVTALLLMPDSYI